MDPLTTADIERRRSHLLALAFVLLAAFACLSVTLSFLDPGLLAPLQGTPTAARLGILALTGAFVALVIERDRTLRRMGRESERLRRLMVDLQSRLDVLESLLEAGDRLNAPLMVQDVLDVLLDSAIALTGADGGAVTTSDGGDGEIAVARRHSVRVDPRQLDVADVAEIPLAVEGRVIGALQLSLPFEREDRVLDEVLARFAERAARALERAHLVTKERASIAYLRAANIVKARFLQTVSHELRTPLTSIVGYSQTLDRHWERLSEDAKLEFARAIEEQSGRLKLLVERILNAAQVELEGVTVRRVLHDVRRSVERGLEHFEHDADRVEIALPDHPCEGEFDPFVVEQAVQNLVDNSLRYSTGPVRVSLDAYRSSVVITVADSGPGIPKADLDLVVNPLYRVDGNSASGTGLGLHIVRTLVTDHGGRLELDSRGGGTVARVTLPRERRAVVAESA